jgi:hypothetical protein
MARTSSSGPARFVRVLLLRRHVPPGALALRALPRFGLGVVPGFTAPAWLAPRRTSDPLVATSLAAIPGDLNDDLGHAPGFCLRKFTVSSFPCAVYFTKYTLLMGTKALYSRLPSISGTAGANKVETDRSARSGRRDVPFNRTSKRSRVAQLRAQHKHTAALAIMRQGQDTVPQEEGSRCRRHHDDHQHTGERDNALTRVAEQDLDTPREVVRDHCATRSSTTALGDHAVCRTPSTT